jgi:hypothetical protein
MSATHFTPRSNLPPEHLALLQVCRQIHAETALLPFPLSTWICRTVNWAESLRRFSPTQAAEIHTLQCHIVWVTNIFWEEVRLESVSRLSPVLGNNFHGLRLLTGLRRIEFEVVDWSHEERKYWAYMLGGRSSYAARVTEVQVKKWLKAFVRPSATSDVEITFRFIKGEQQ